MKPFVPILLLSLVLGGCVRLDDRGFDNVNLRADARALKAVEIGAYTPFAWDRLYVFGHRSTRETISEEIGRSVPFPHREAETHCLLVFVSGGGVVAAFEEPRGLVDFDNLPRKGGYSRAESKFKGAPSGDGALLLPGS